MAKTNLTAERLRECLHYDPQTGVFKWRMRIGRGRIGKIAGITTARRYIRIGVLGCEYMAHRLAWLYVHGAWPHAEIDHIDGDPANNALANLREASRPENLQNLKKANPRNKTGLIGAHRRSNGRYRSHLQSGGRIICLGSFATAEEAHKAYVEAKRKFHSFNTL